VNDFYRAFSRSSDGWWTCVAPVTLERPAGRVQVAEGTRLCAGMMFMGIDVVALLEDERRRREMV